MSETRSPGSPTPSLRASDHSKLLEYRATATLLSRVRPQLVEDDQLALDDPVDFHPVPSVWFDCA